MFISNELIQSVFDETNLYADHHSRWQSLTTCCSSCIEDCYSFKHENIPTVSPFFSLVSFISLNLKCTGILTTCYPLPTSTRSCLTPGLKLYREFVSDNEAEPAKRTDRLYTVSPGICPNSMNCILNILKRLWSRGLAIGLYNLQTSKPFWYTVLLYHETAETLAWETVPDWVSALSPSRHWLSVFHGYLSHFCSAVWVPVKSRWESPETPWYDIITTRHTWYYIIAICFLHFVICWVLQTHIFQLEAMFQTQTMPSKLNFVNICCMLQNDITCTLILSANASIYMYVGTRQIQSAISLTSICS